MQRLLSSVVRQLTPSPPHNYPSTLGKWLWVPTETWSGSHRSCTTPAPPPPKLPDSGTSAALPSIHKALCFHCNLFLLKIMSSCAQAHSPICQPAACYLGSEEREYNFNCSLCCKLSYRRAALIFTKTHGRHYTSLQQHYTTTAHASHYTSLYSMVIHNTKMAGCWLDGGPMFSSYIIYGGGTVLHDYMTELQNMIILERLHYWLYTPLPWNTHKLD